MVLIVVTYVPAVHFLSRECEVTHQFAVVECDLEFTNSSVSSYIVKLSLRLKGERNILNVGL
jgi:hypothetical protein